MGRKTFCFTQAGRENTLRKRGILLQKKMQNRFISLLRETNREGLDRVIYQLEELGFFSAPASSRFHLSRPGGLLEHSLNVYDSAILIRDGLLNRIPELESQLPLDSIAICTLLHDVCKTDIYKPAIVSRRNEQGCWEKYNGYQVDYTDMPLGHGEKSVILLLRWGRILTKDEMLAIRWHMGAWDLPFQSPEYKGCMEVAKSLTPLCSLVQAADNISAGIVER